MSTRTEKAAVKYMTLEQMFQRVEELRAARKDQEVQHEPGESAEGTINWAPEFTAQLEPLSQGPSDEMTGPFADLLKEGNFLWFGKELAVRFDESGAELPPQAVASAPPKPRVYEFAAYLRERATRLPLRHIAAGAVAAALAGLIAAPSLFNFDSGQRAERLMAAARNLQAGSEPYNELQDADQLGDFTLVSNPPLPASLAQARFSPARAEEKIREALSVRGFTDIGVSAGPSGDVYLAGDVYSDNEAKYVTRIAKHAVRTASIHFLHPDILTPSGPAYFGVSTAPDPKLLGAKVTAVAIGSPAYKAGIRSGDLIRGFDGELVPDAETLTALVEAYQPGDRVTVRLWRGDGNQFLVVRLSKFTDLALK